ncbi:MAG: redoxin domain-containing protein [Kofleriaceae bacterium]
MKATALAPPWRTTEWLNTPAPLTLEQLRGRVVLVHAFQMLCPGCVSRGIPQAQRVAELFADAPLVVVGLHTVFEHHDGMKVESLRAFLHEYRVRFPVGVDAPDPDGAPIPQTMRAYGMRGTPTTLLIDARGRLRRQVFGVHDDLILGAELQTLLLEAASDVKDGLPAANASGGGGEAGRALPDTST